MKRFAVVMQLVLCTVALDAAAAQQNAWYAGAAAGVSRVDMTTSDWNNATLIDEDLNTQASAYKLTAGYHFLTHLAGELEYLHFGDVKFTAYETGAAPSIWQTGDVYGKAESQGVSVTGVASWPSAKRFAVFARGGILYWNTTMTSYPTLAGGTLALSEEQVIHDDGVNFIYGAGAEMRVYRQWHMRLEWEHTTVGLAGTMERGVDFASLGVTLDF